jgi:hypothetical protein
LKAREEGLEVALAHGEGVFSNNQRLYK